MMPSLLKYWQITDNRQSNHSAESDSYDEIDDFGNEIDEEIVSCS